MVIKKKVGLSIFFCSLLLVLFGSVSSVFGYVSNDYLDYAFDTLSQGSYNSSSNMTTTYQGFFNTIKNNTQYKTDILQHLNDFLDTKNYPNLNDHNLIFFIVNDNRTTTMFIYAIFSNVGAPNGYDNLGYLKINTNTNGNIASLTPLDTDPILVYSIQYLPNNSTKFNYTETNINSGKSMFFNGQVFNNENTVAQSTSIACAYLPSVNIKNTLNSQYYYMNLIDLNGNFEPPTPPEPPTPDNTTGNIYDNSGDKTGSIDLTNIENGISNINNSINNQGQNIVNAISGETQAINNIKETLTIVPDLSGETITSGEIIDALNIGVLDNPYTSFWVAITSALGDALTDSVRTIYITFRGQSYAINLDNYTLQLPQPLKEFFSIFSSAFIIWVMVRYWKIIIDKITSGSIDEVLEMNEEERHC